MPSSDKPKEWKSTLQAMTKSIGKKRINQKGVREPSANAVSPKELDVLLDKWIVDELFKPNHLSREPIEMERTTFLPPA